MSQQVRCPSRIHLVVIPERNCYEVKCTSRHCGAGSGYVVFHYFDLTTHQLIETKQYQSPEALFKRG